MQHAKEEIGNIPEGAVVATTPDIIVTVWVRFISGRAFRTEVPVSSSFPQKEAEKLAINKITQAIDYGNELIYGYWHLKAPGPIEDVWSDVRPSAVQIPNHAVEAISVYPQEAK